jgi:hypothetical protein
MRPTVSPGGPTCLLNSHAHETEDTFFGGWAGPLAYPHHSHTCGLRAVPTHGIWSHRQWYLTHRVVTLLSGPRCATPQALN